MSSMPITRRPEAPGGRPALPGPPVEVLHPQTSQGAVQYDYLSVSGAANWLQKSPSRIYAMVRNGTLTLVGMRVLRAGGNIKPRIWIGMPKER
jgi:hypothetical protein